MTGESLPVDKAPGDEVYSGTVNRFGSVKIRPVEGMEAGEYRLAPIDG